MENVDLLHVEYWKPFAQFGLTNHFFNINKETIISTWILLGLLLIIVLSIRFLLQSNYPTAKFVIIRFVDWFATISIQTLGRFYFNHFALVTALFIFIFASSLLALIPGIEEPTKDINTTLALGLISFLYIQAYTIKEYGLYGYIQKEFMTPLMMLPLHIIGKFATIISISFRLFGNIFGGATISNIYFNATQSYWLAQTLALGTGLNLTILLFFGIFEGFLQAFVFSMLTLTYLSISLEAEHEIEAAS